MAKAQVSALNGESSMGIGAPKRPMISSPTNLSRVPVYWNSTSTMTSKYSLSMLTTSLGGTPSDMAVKPRISENSIVISVRRPPRSSASSPLTTCSTTAGGMRRENCARVRASFSMRVARRAF